MRAHAACMSNASKNPVVHFEVLGRDPNALRKFYSEALGWVAGPADDSPFEYSMIQPGEGKGIAGGIGKAPQGPGHVTFYVAVSYPQATPDPITGPGGRPVHPVFVGPRGPTLPTSADPARASVGL